MEETILNEYNNNNDDHDAIDPATAAASAPLHRWLRPPVHGALRGAAREGGRERPAAFGGRRRGEECGHIRAPLQFSVVGVQLLPEALGRNANALSPV